MNKGVCLLLALVCGVSIQSLAQATEPFSLALSASQTELQRGAQVDVAIRLTNTSDRILTLLTTFAEMDYRVTVVSVDGRAVSATQYGRSLMGAGVVPTSRVFVNLKPKEVLTDHLVVSELYEMDVPGTYEIQVQRKLPETPEGGPMKSNSIIVKVK